MSSVCKPKPTLYTDDETAQPVNTTLYPLVVVADKNGLEVISKTPELSKSYLF